ncbi:hypothetical protein E0L32_012452, partial [Thyridium curvatum]
MRGIGDVEVHRQQRAVLPPEHQRAGGEDRRLPAGQRPVEGDAVALGHLRLRADDPVEQSAIVGQQQEARGLLVEPPDGRERRVTAAPALRQKPVDQRTGLLVRAGHAER